MLNKFYLFVAFVFCLIMLGCVDNLPEKKGSIDEVWKLTCDIGFDDKCIYNCDSNVYVSRNHGGDVAVYINGSNGEILKRCLYYELSDDADCAVLSKSCDYKTPADYMPENVLKSFNAHPPIGFGDYDDVPRYN